MKVDKSKLIVKKLGLNELDAFVDFVIYAKSKMKHPEWIGEISKSSFLKMMNNDASIYVWTSMKDINKELTNVDQFVACGIIMPAKQTEPRRLMQTDLKYKEVVILGQEIVHPNSVGSGLQMEVIEYLEVIAKNQGYRYALGTIDLENIFALRNMLKKDYNIATKIDVKGEKKLVLRKEL